MTSSREPIDYAPPRRDRPKVARGAKVCGVALLLAGVAALAVTHFAIVRPALTLQPNGNYGEMYGPMSYFRWPLYGIASVPVALGAGVLALGNQR